MTCAVELGRWRGRRQKTVGDVTKAKRARNSDLLNDPSSQAGSATPWATLRTKAPRPRRRKHSQAFARSCYGNEANSTPGRVREPDPLRGRISEASDALSESPHRFRQVVTITITHSEKSHIHRMKAWPYRQECRGHGPTKRIFFAGVACSLARCAGTNC